eukprot:1543814-Pyramimonas_sp.AAC.1
MEDGSLFELWLWLFAWRRFASDFCTRFKDGGRFLFKLWLSPLRRAFVCSPQLQGWRAAPYQAVVLAFNVAHIRWDWQDAAVMLIRCVEFPGTAFGQY